MSSYAARAVHPRTGKTEAALFLDEFYGPNAYAVRFADGSTFPRGLAEGQAREVPGPELSETEAKALFSSPEMSVSQLSEAEAKELFSSPEMSEDGPPTGGMKP